MRSLRYFHNRLAAIMSAAFAAAMTTACSADVPAGAQGDEQGGFTPYGRWRVVSIDGSPARPGGPSLGEPILAFTSEGYGGFSGCNAFGGHGLWLDGRWYADRAMANQMACPDVQGQESRLMEALASGPIITAKGPNGAVVHTARGEIVLARLEDAPGASTVMTQHGSLLHGGAWLIVGVDGAQAATAADLQLEAATWAVRSACGVSQGRWSQNGEAIALKAARSDAACADDPLHGAIRAMATGEGRFVTGPNGELVMAAGGHWITAREDRAVPPNTLSRIRGAWRVSRLNGKPLATGSSAPGIGVGEASYWLYDGCNRTEGLSIAAHRRLFTRGSGLSTLVQCAPDSDRARIGAIIASNPRVASGADGETVLISEQGALALTRAEGPAPRDLTTGLRGGLRAIVDKSGARLELGRDGRFSVTLGCASFRGEWRPGRVARFSPGPLETTDAACDTTPTSPVFDLQQFFTGDVMAVADANGRQLLMVNQTRALAADTAP